MAASTPKHAKTTKISLKETPKTLSNKQKGKGINTKIPSTANQVEPQCTAPSSWEDDIPWNWASLTDPSSSRISPIFTKDGSYFFSLVGSSVKIYSTATGSVVSTLTSPTLADAKSQSDILTSAVLNPSNAFQLITGSLDGKVMIWDFINATLLQTIDVGQPIHYICCHEQFKGSIFVAASLSKKKVGGNDKNAVVMQISIKSSDSTGSHEGITFIGKTKLPSGLAISANGAWLVAAAGHTIYVAKTSSLSSGFTKYVSPERLRCLAFHPSEEYFATGDDKGVIRLWYCLNDNLAVNAHGVEKRTQTRLLHWHAHAVSSLSFTPNGAYLLSGGEESVLVIWQLHTGKKEFVPRLGAPISTVSILSPKNGVGEEEYLIGLADATYIFIRATTLKVSRSYSRIKIDPAQTSNLTPAAKATSTPIAVHPLTSTFILPSSHPSSLQIYSPFGSTLLGELEISPSNRVSRRDDKPLTFAHVDNVAISSSGDWMATVDSREGDAGFPTDVYLKFWFWDKKQDNWTLNTRIDRPHGTARVTDISFSPASSDNTASKLISTGKDGLIKVWKLLSRPVASGSTTVVGAANDSWVSFSSLNFRTETPSSVSWSPDTSLFAVAVGAYIAVYNALSGSLCQTLTLPTTEKTFLVHFIGNNGRYLLATYEKSLVMWDLISSCVAWSYVPPQPIVKVIPHPKEASFAVLHSPTTDGDERRTTVSTYQASSNSPTAIYSLPFGLQNAALASSPSPSTSGFNLVGITHSWRVVLFGDSKQILKDLTNTAKTIHTQHQPQKRTLFEDIFGASAFASNHSDHVHVADLQRKDGKPADMFDTPVYLAPSLSSMFNPLISTYLTPRPAETRITDKTVDDDGDEDVIMEEEQDIPITSLGHASRVPNPGEMDAFTKLFRARCMTGSPPAGPVVPKKINGVHPKEIKGIPRVLETPLSRPKRLSIHAADNNALPAYNAATPSPLLNGKKRKKVSS